MNFINSFILGNLEDQTAIFVKSFYYQKDSILQLNASNQPLFMLSYEILGTILNPIFYTNLYSIIQILLNFIAAYLFFNKFFKIKSLVAVLSLILVGSPFTYYNIGTHPALLNYWPALITLAIYFDNSIKSFTKTCLIGLMLSVTFLFNNYFGFYLLIFYSLLILLNFLSARKNYMLLKQYIISITLFSGISYLGLISYFQNPIATNGISSLNSLEDFFYFSSRPWYYFLPAPTNPLFGNITIFSINFLQTNWGHWLTLNYMPTEHTTSFLGWITFILALIGAYYIYRNSIKNKAPLYRLAIVAALLILLSMPPYITISGLKIYMPSYLIYVIFPMFRNTARLGLLILLIELLFAGYGYLYLITKLRIEKTKALSYLVLILIAVISLTEFYTPITITKIDSAPTIFSYIKNETPTDTKLVVYPYNSTLSAEYWVKEHNRIILNPRGQIVEAKLNTENFTADLQTEAGLLKAKEMGANYLIFFKNAGNKYRSKELSIFQNSPHLKYVTEYNFDTPYIEDKIFFKLKNLGDTTESSAILYEIL